MVKTKHRQTMSFSCLKLWMQCPRSWWARYVEKEESSTGTAAQIGTCFGEQAVKRMVNQEGKPVPVNKDRPGGDDPEMQLSAENELYVSKMLDAYFAHELSWKVADIAEKKINLTPDRMYVLGEHYEVNYPSYPLKTLTGYIDLFRRINGIPEFIDLKTAGKKGFNEFWPVQNAIYAMAEEAVKCQIHCVVKNVKPVPWFYDIELKPELFKWVLELVFSVSDQIYLAESTGGKGVHCRPGFQCGWCSRNYKCPVSIMSKVQPING